MKKLKLNQLEMIEGGGHSDGIISAINWGCVGVTGLGIAAGFFTLGAGTVFALTVAASACLGAQIGQAAANNYPY